MIALRQLGFHKALGTDLVPFRDIVIEDDIHDMKFEDNSVGFFYTNIFDHVLYPDKVISEINRCLKKGGKVLFQLQLGHPLLKYGTCLIEHPNDFHNLIDCFPDLNIIFSDINIVNPFENCSTGEKNAYIQTNHHFPEETMGSKYNLDLNWNVIVEKETKTDIDIRLDDKTRKIVIFQKTILLKSLESGEQPRTVVMRKKNLTKNK